ncbi:MAG: DUF3373 family protein [Desulfobacteraceae bacterium]|nr:DUF3373 family protein [Desulfobacteraceae bacterium]
MKRIAMTAAAVLIGAGSVHAAPETVTLPLEDYKAILHRLDSLQQRVEQLESGKAAAAPAPAAPAAAAPAAPATAASAPAAGEAGLKKDVASIYDTLDKVETKTLKDRLNLGAELRTRMDFYNVDNYLDPINGVRSDHNDNAWTNRFRLNMDAEVAENLQFHGRLAVYKNWADNQSPLILSDPNAAHVPDSTNVKLDRAYIDWVPSGLPVPVAFTFGRQPSSEGPPFELKENRLRQSTYPALIFDGESDGVVATIGLERYLGIKDSGLRFFYAKGFQDDDNFVTFMDSTANIKDLNVYAAFFEGEVPGLRDSLFVLSYVRGNDFVGGPLVDAFNTAFRARNYNYEDTNIGNMDLYGAHVQAANLLNSGFDVFLSTGLNESHPNGRTIVDANDINNSLGGLLSADGSSDHTGWSVYTGFRYNLPIASLNMPKIGFEYNHGSEYWFSYTQGSAELFNKLGTRGNVYDLYYLQPFNKYLFLRTGYTLIDYDYTGSGVHLGEPLPTDAELRNVYMLIDARF